MTNKTGTPTLCRSSTHRTHHTQATGKRKDSLELVKVDGPGALADRDAGRGLGARVEGHVDALAALKGDGGEVLVEKGLEDDDLVAGLDERGERGVLAWKRTTSARVKPGRSHRGGAESACHT